MGKNDEFVDTEDLITDRHLKNVCWMGSVIRTERASDVKMQCHTKLCANRYAQIPQCFKQELVRRVEGGDFLIL